MSNEVANVQGRAPIEAGGSVAAIIPRNMDELARFATMVADSGMAPAGMSKPQQIAVAVMKGLEVGLAPFQSLHNIAVINGRPTIWGDALPALLRRAGHRMTETLDGEDESMVATCRVIRVDGEEIERSFTVAYAKRAGLWGKKGPWEQYPQRMLQMRARSWAVRDGAADVLNGLYVAEEERDVRPMRNVTPADGGEKKRIMQRLAPRPAAEPEAKLADPHEEPAAPDAQPDPFSEAYDAGMAAHGEGIKPGDMPEDLREPDKLNWRAGWNQADKNAEEAE